MKTFIYVIGLLLSVNVYAGVNCETSTSNEEVKEQLEIKTDVPKHLVGATVCVKLADGRESCVPAEKFKVVPRQQQFIVTKVEQHSQTQCVMDKTTQHRVSALIGKGPKNSVSVDTSNAPNRVDVSNRYGTIGGLQYQYKFEDSNWSVPVQVQSNESALIGLGYDF